MHRHFFLKKQPKYKNAEAVVFRGKFRFCHLTSDFCPLFSDFCRLIFIGLSFLIINIGLQDFDNPWNILFGLA